MSAPKTRKLPERPGIVFMATPDFALPSLDALVSHKHRVQAVVTQPDRPKGRSGKPMPPPVKVAAQRLGLKILQQEKASEDSFCRVIEGLSPDLLVVIAFGQILSPQLLDIPSWGALNIHASLLPRYRGAAPIQRAIMEGETETGLSAMRMEAGLDSGPILLQERTPIGPHETAGELHDRLAMMAAPFLLETLRALSEGTVIEKPQDAALVTYAKKIDRRTGRVVWDRPANEISALIRGLDPWPGAHTTLNGRTLKLFSSRDLKIDDTETVPGKVRGQSKEGIIVETGKGAILIEALQLAGKKRVPAWDFLRGFPIDPGTVLGNKE